MVLQRNVRDLLVAAGLLALPLVFLRAHLRGPRDAGPLDRVLLTLSAPLQAAATGAAEKVGGVWRNYLFLVHLREQNERLRKDNVRLRAEADRAERAEERAARLEGLLGLRARTPSETLGARVVARDLSPLFRVVRVKLDRGAAEVRAGMPVIVPQGVVGRVGRTFGEWSDVVLLVDPESAVDVRVEPSGARGIARGLAARDRYACRLQYVLREDVVRVGDRVVTSGQDGVFPRDLEVGRVAHVARRDLGLYQEVEVVPAVDFAALEELLIVLAPPPADDPEARGRHQVPARGVTVHR